MVKLSVKAIGEMAGKKEMLKKVVELKGELMNVSFWACCCVFACGSVLGGFGARLCELDASVARRVTLVMGGTDQILVRLRRV